MCSWLTNLSKHIGSSNRQHKHNRIEDHTQPSSEILTTQRTRTFNTHIYLHVDIILTISYKRTQARSYEILRIPASSGKMAQSIGPPAEPETGTQNHRRPA